MQPRASKQLPTHFLQRARPAGCDMRVWKLQENKLVFFKAPKRLRRCFTLLLGLSSQYFGVFGSKIRLLQSSLCLCFICLCIVQSLLPQFADLVMMAFKAPPERMVAARGARTFIGKEQKGFRAGGSATLYIKIAPGSIAPQPWRQPCSKEPPVSLSTGRLWLTRRGRGVQQGRVPSLPPHAASCTSGLMCYQLTVLLGAPRVDKNWLILDIQQQPLDVRCT